MSGSSFARPVAPHSDVTVAPACGDSSYRTPGAPAQVSEAADSLKGHQRLLTPQVWCHALAHLLVMNDLDLQ